METFSALLAICAGNSLVTGEFPVQRPVTWNFDVFVDLRQKVNNRDASDFRRHHARYDVILMILDYKNHHFAMSQHHWTCINK